MQRVSESYWRQAVWKIVSNPAIEVVVAIVVVLITSSVVILTEAENRHTAFPVPLIGK